ncbi:MAG TPA: MBL fold metallo-hydrolase [Gemmatimonadales bacterium]|nr:MBL fold metallo-hydrolase [Gemmatimonadales bacterium]
MRLVVLGSGTSFGVPQVGCSCAICGSSDPRDRRTRVAAVVESATGERILIDTPPELRLQLLAAGVASVDAVLYTHDHADHIHGIDDLRAFTARRGALPIFGPPDTLERLASRFGYIFDDGAPREPETPRPELRPCPLEPGVERVIAGLPVLPLEFEHGLARVYGYRIGDLAYVTDVKAVPPAARERLRGVRLLVLSALFDRPHPTHLSIPEAVAVAQAIGAERTLLTHLTHRYGHAELAARLPAGVEPAWDGLTVSF